MRAASRDLAGPIRAASGAAEHANVAAVTGERHSSPMSDIRMFGDGPRRVNVYRVRDGKITEIDIFEADQYDVDEFVG